MRGILALGLAATGCGAGATGEAVRPADPTASGALGEQDSGPAQCRSVASTAEPLVVDWKSNQRLDLELAMKEGVAVVSYDCKAIKLLKGCKVDGSYAFAGVSRKEDVVQLTNADEVQANLPLSAASLSGEVKRGSTIDLALVMIGKKGTTVAQATTPELVGSCEGATHFVRAAFVGAFAMGTGTVGQVRATADMFGAGVSGSSSSEKKASNKDGDIEACRKSTADAAAPPDQCQAAIRLELVPIAAQAAPGDADAKREATVNPCPEGMVLTGGKCATASAAGAHLCDPKATSECLTQCDKGDAGSCYHAAAAQLEGRDGVAKDRAKGMANLQKSCDGGTARACYRLGDLLMTDRMHAKEDSAKTELRLKAEERYNKACQLGDGWVCWNLSSWYLSKSADSAFPRDPARAVSLVRRGCDLGYAPSCNSLAGILLAGEHTKKDVPTAIGLLQRACDGGRWEDCEAMGNLYRKGEGVAKDAALAVEAYDKACAKGGARACHSAGALHLKGEGVAKDAVKARTFFERGCTDKVIGWDACLALGEMLDKGTGVTKDKQLAAEVWERGCMNGACGRAGDIWAKGDGVKADLDKAVAAYRKGCERASDKRSCDAVGPLLEKKDIEQAKSWYVDRCSRSSDAGACAAAKRHGATIPERPAGSGGIFPPGTKK